jgi:hypothetical protein
MTRLISLVLLVAGIVLIGYGVIASDSISSDVSRFFTGAPTDKTIWFLLSGIAAAALGSSGLAYSTRAN